MKSAPQPVPPPDAPPTLAPVQVMETALAARHGLTVTQARDGAIELKRDLEEAGYAIVRVKPSPGLLVSMAIRYRHDFGLQHGEIGIWRIGLDDGERRGLLATMGQLHEEVVGTGFYQPHKEADYVKVFPAAAGPDA